MPNADTSKHTVTTDEEFVDLLCEYYPAATSVSQAIVMAAQDGLEFRRSFNSDLKRYIRMTVRETTLEEFEIKDGPE